MPETTAQYATGKRKTAIARVWLSADGDGSITVNGKPADEYFERDRYREWCAEHLPHLDEQVWDWVSSDDFDRLLRQTVQATYPAHEQEQFVAHFRGLMDLWIRDNAAQPAS